MIIAFITEKMNHYIAGGMKPENAAQYARRELAAIYEGDHYSRDASGTLRVTPPPESLDLKTAMEKADAAIAGIIRQYPAPAGKPRNIYRSSDAIKRAIAAGISIKDFYIKSGDNDPTA